MDPLSNDDSDTEYFPEDLLNNIPEDSDCSDEEDNSRSPENNPANPDSSSPPLVLEVDLTFLTWKSAYDYKGFYSKRKIRKTAK